MLRKSSDAHQRSELWRCGVDIFEEFIYTCLALRSMFSWRSQNIARAACDTTYSDFIYSGMHVGIQDTADSYGFWVRIVADNEKNNSFSRMSVRWGMNTSLIIPSTGTIRVTASCWRYCPARLLNRISINTVLNILSVCMVKLTGPADISFPTTSKIGKTSHHGLQRPTNSNRLKRNRQRTSTRDVVDTTCAKGMSIMHPKISTSI